MNSSPRSKQNLFRFGTAYYPDYIQDGRLGRTISGEIKAMSFEERLHNDFMRMERAGIQEIRMGEFAWSTLEPEPGSFHPERFLAALDRAHAHGISVYFCTPTATPPKWLVDQMPDMLPQDAYGHVHAFGSRRHYDPCHPGFREHSRRITEKVAKAFGSHPSVIAWQIDNELGHHGTHECRSQAAQEAFRAWLRQTYKGDIARLNRDWFTAFWSQNYRSFDEIEIPMYTWAGVGPHIEMAYRRFYNDSYRAFQAEQCAILRTYSSGRQITTNLISNFYGLCPWQLTDDLDVVGYDHYQDDPYPNPIRSASNFTLMRSLKGQRFKVLEQQPVQVNWQKINRRFAFDWLWLWAFQAAAFGADTMHYFSWQRFSGGPEQYHDGILPHDVRNPRSNQEKVLQASYDLFAICEQKLGWKKFPEIPIEFLIVHNTESLWSHRICAQSEHYDSTVEIDRMTKLCSQLGIGFQFTDKIPSDLSVYPELRCLILPGYAFEFTEQEQNSMRQFVSQGGWILTFPRTAMKTPDQHMSSLPSSILDSTSYYLIEYGALGPEEQEAISLNTLDLRGERWAEKLAFSDKSEYQTLASFRDGLYHGSPAIIQRTFGLGGHLHFAFCPILNQDFCKWFANLSFVPNRSSALQDAEMQVIPLTHQNQENLVLINFSQTSIRWQLNGTYEPRLLFQLDADLELTHKINPSLPTEIPARSIVIFKKLS